jgi:hypothetical protein
MPFAKNAEKSPAAEAPGEDLSRPLELPVKLTVLMRSLKPPRPSGTLAMGRMMGEANPPGLMVLSEAIIPLGNGGLVHFITALGTGLILMGMMMMAHMAIVVTLALMIGQILTDLALMTSLRRTLLT